MKFVSLFFANSLSLQIRALFNKEPNIFFFPNVYNLLGFCLLCILLAAKPQHIWHELLKLYHSLNVFFNSKTVERNPNEYYHIQNAQSIFLLFMLLSKNQMMMEKKWTK